MKRMQNPQKLVCGKFYVHEIVAVNLSQIYFLKNTKKTCKPKNHEWIAKTVKQSSHWGCPWCLYC